MKDSLFHKILYEIFYTRTLKSINHETPTGTKGQINVNSGAKQGRKETYYTKRVTYSSYPGRSLHCSTTLNKSFFSPPSLLYSFIRFFFSFGLVTCDQSWKRNVGPNRLLKSIKFQMKKKLKIWCCNRTLIYKIKMDMFVNSYSFSKKKSHIYRLKKNEHRFVPSNILRLL